MPSHQQQIFTELHFQILKPQGFRKLAARSELSLGQLHQAVACHSSRFNTASEVDFTIELRVGHEDFFRLWQPHAKFPGLGERAFMPLLAWRLTERDPRIEKWWRLSGAHDLPAIQEDVLRVFNEQGLPALEQTRTLDGIIQFCASKGPRAFFQAHSWALHAVGRTAEAYAVVDAAVLAAPHEKARSHALAWRERLDA